MNRKFVSAIGITITAFIILLTSCRRINDSTQLGDDLIPPIDNINTFDTAITAFAFNDTFRLENDSQFVTRRDEFFLGRIDNDPFFGKTDARMYFELKPSGYGLYPFARRDSVKIDSLVLILSYIETYGDTNIAQRIRTYEITSEGFRYDSFYVMQREPVVYGPILSENPSGQLVFPRNLKDSVKVFGDTTNRQLRLRLDTNLARRFFNYDTINSYKSDSAFRVNFKGFALRSESPANAVMGFDLNGANTKLAFYYRHPKGNGTGDTAKVTYFKFTPVSAYANFIKRDYTGSSLATAVGGSLPDPFIYIQKTPGSFAIIKIPGLASLTNRVVHRAELILEQAYHQSDAIFGPPELLYLDAFDTSLNARRTIPYDFAFSTGGASNLVSFGSLPRSALDPGGNQIKVWRFNISRYVQNVLTKKLPVFDLHLSAPYLPYFLKKAYYGEPPVEIDFRLKNEFFVNPTYTKGRVRLFGNTGPADSNPQRLRLRIIYSKL